jgi:hypothetical protein
MLCVGSLNELKDQSRVIQDIRFNVPDTIVDKNVLLGLFGGTLKIIKEQSNQSYNLTTLGFGPNTFDTVPSFRPGQYITTQS